MTTELTDLLEDTRPAPKRRFNVTAVVLTVGAFMMLSVIGFTLARQGKSQPTSGPAPDFTLTTFDGEAFRLSDQRGKLVVVNFWASWCVPCREEAPLLQTVWEQYRERGVMLVGVAYIDIERDSLAFIEEFGITYPNGLDVGTHISDRYRIRGVPETFVIDQAGNIAEFYIGPAREGQLEDILNRLLDHRNK